MELVRHASYNDFLSAAGPMLTGREAEYNLMLAIVGSRARAVDPNASAPFLATLHENGQVVAAAVQTPPHQLVTTELPPEAVTMLVEALRHEPVAGVHGPPETARAVALAWSPDSKLRLRLRVLAAREVTPPPPVPGALRRCVESDLPLLTEWIEAFSRDAHANLMGTDAQTRARRHLDGGDAYLWVDGERALSMAVVVGRTPNGIRVGGVYTPAALRGHGYAAACVGALTQRMFDEGRSFCFLYTDASNPTSNRLYERLGYRFVCDIEEWAFASS
ncbi:MAG: GNAT family N-acetyltransferase [Deltaproteobacteria bacterium]|nr:GNAT family N-acetyltransferase [Deltaproteobacteria bacterium]